MIGQRQQDGSRQVVASADDERGIRLGEHRQEGVRVGHLRMIDQNDADVLARHLANDGPVALDEELLELDGKMSRLARNLKGAFNQVAVLGKNEDHPWQRALILCRRLRYYAAPPIASVCLQDFLVAFEHCNST